jgi:hypothetical protein
MFFGKETLQAAVLAAALTALQRAITGAAVKSQPLSSSIVALDQKQDKYG